MTRFFLLLSLLASTSFGAITLEGSTDALEVTTSTTAAIDYAVVWTNVTATALTTPGTGVGQITTATTTTLVSAPSASNWRYIRNLILHNVSTTTSNTVAIQIDRSASNRVLWNVTLAPDEHLRIDETGGITLYAASGIIKTTPSATGTGASFSLLKVGATSEAVGLWYGHAKDTGFPSSWVPGTPGLNGDALDCSTAADATIAGAHLLPNATTAYYLVANNVGASVAHLYGLVDLIWYNTGLVVTTTTAQTVTPPTLPSRDTNGSNNGDGWQAAIYVTTATTNAGAVTNTTLSYTDSDGNAGNTATIASFPATAVAGAFIPFQLAAGDRGIRNIASITLGTSYVTGAISLVLYRPLSYVPSPLANVGGALLPLDSTANTRIYNGTCFWQNYLASATTATTTNAMWMLVDR